MPVGCGPKIHETCPGVRGAEVSVGVAVGAGVGAGVGAALANAAAATREAKMDFMLSDRPFFVQRRLVKEKKGSPEGVGSHRSFVVLDRVGVVSA